MDVRSFIVSYRFSLCVLLAIVYLSLVLNPSHLPEPSLCLADKWAHIAMYFGFSMTVWMEFYRVHRNSLSLLKAWIMACVIPAVIGGAMELGQKYLTTYRGADWMDALANTLGAVAASLVATSIILLFLRGRKQRK